MAEELSFANVHRAVNGILRYVALQKPAEANVTVGRDACFRNLVVKVGSFCLKRENFRLTPEVKEKFTEKLKQN